MGKVLALHTLSEKTLHQHADPKLIAYCPSMDLVALVTTDQQVLIYRLNGQRVYGALQKAGDLKIESIKWKPNGQLLAIAWSDGSVRLVGAESSKVVHQFSTGNEVSGVTCVGWSSNLTGRTPSLIDGTKAPESWESLLSGDNELLGKKTQLDLPRHLSLIDIETSLPKLSVLASVVGSEDVFSSRPSLDALFRPFDPNDNNSVDVMVVGTNEGNIHLSIYDTFLIGSFSSPLVSNSLRSHLVLHASHEQCSTHALLMKSTISETLSFVPMDLRFISASSEYLSLLASRSTALHNLLRYIHQVQLLMISEWKTTQDLPSRFLKNINETLAEKDTRDIVQALYHSVATGHTFPVVREWLVDELAERGHKRWDKAVVTGLDNLKRLVHENMLPALERCSVILSRFSGIARFQGSNETVSFTNQQISLISDTVACLHLVSSKILIQVVDEIELFTAFSSWLRYEIDRLASEGSSTPSDDAAEKEEAIDHAKVLLYIQSIMTTSPLQIYFGDSTPEDQENWNHSQQGLPMFDTLEKQLRKQEKGLPYNESLPRVGLLYKLLSRQAETIFGQIAETEKRNVLFRQGHEVGMAERVGLVDVKMAVMDDTACQVYVALVPKGLGSTLHITRFSLSIEKGISSVRAIGSSTVQLGDSKILDLKFSDDNQLLVLCETPVWTALLAIPYDKSLVENPAFDGECLEYAPVTKSNQSPRLMALTNNEVIERFPRHRVATDDSFVPESFDVRQQNLTTRRLSKQRIVLLERDKLHYNILQFAESVSENEGQIDGDVSMS